MISVPGIGPVIATELLVATNEMQTINDPKKLAASAVRLSRRGCPFRVPIRHEYSSRTADAVKPESVTRLGSD